MLATWVAFLLYALAALALGWLAHRRREAGVTYWTAGRSLDGLSVGLSISAGFLSVSWSCVYAVQLFYWYGIGALWLITIPWLAALAGIYLLASRYHQLPAVSQPEMVGRRFGRGAQRLVAVAVAFVFLVWGGAEIYVASTLLAPGMGVSPTLLILLISLVVGYYATLGGFRAVVNTDKLQYGLVVLYLLAMSWLAIEGLGSLAGGGATLESMAANSGETFRSLIASGALRGAKSGASWTALLAPGLATILLTFAAYLPGWTFETDLWLRVQAARDPRAARRGVLLAAANALLFVGVVPLFIGVAALAIFPLQNGSFPAIVGNQGDAIFAALVSRFAPAWLGVGVAVGLVAAAMSTIDTCTNVMALSLAYDLMGVAERPAKEARGRRAAERRSRLATAGSVAAACLFALNTESLWEIFYLSSGILTTTVAFPVAAVFLPWAKPRAVTWSAAAGFTSTFVAYFLESRGLLAALEPTWMAASGLGYIVWGIVAATLGGVAGTLTDRRPSLEAGASRHQA
ncbi:MAG: sodium:solute symporter [Acidobacteriota bacterium]